MKKCRYCKGWHHHSLCGIRYPRYPPEGTEIPPAEEEGVRFIPRSATERLRRNLASSWTCGTIGPNRLPYEAFLYTNDFWAYCPAAMTKVSRTCHVGTEINTPRIRIMLDSGMTSSTIDFHLVCKLGLELWGKSKMSVATSFAEQHVTMDMWSSCVYLWDKRDQPIPLPVQVVDSLGPKYCMPALPRRLRKIVIEHMMGRVAHSTYKDDLKEPIHLVVGTDAMWDLLEFGGDPAVPIKHGLQMIPTRLGYILVGKVPSYAWNEREQLLNAEEPDDLDGDSDSDPGDPFELS